MAGMEMLRIVFKNGGVLSRVTSMASGRVFKTSTGRSERKRKYQSKIQENEYI
jgi:hypothetical protein